MTEIKPDGSASVDVESVQDAAMSDDARLVSVMVSDHRLYTSFRVLDFLRTCTLEELREAFDTLGQIMDDPRSMRTSSDEVAP